MLLTSILFLPLLAGLLCLFARPRRLVEMLNWRPSPAPWFSA